MGKELEKWFNKWHRKLVTGRCLIELKEMNKIITNKTYDKLATEIDDYLLEELEITIDASKTTELMNIILNNLGIKKE